MELLFECIMPQKNITRHIHVYFQDQKASIGILDGEILNGTLSTRQLKLVLAWIEIHKDELLANWSLCQNGEKPFKIEPLK